MHNEEIAQVLSEIADLLEISDEDHFRVLSYRKAAETVADHPRELVTLLAEGGPPALHEVPGVGESLAGKIAELLQTGQITFHQELKAKYPPGLLELLQIPGLGPKKVALFYRELGIGSVDDLAQAAEQHHLRDLPGMGAKSEEKLLHGLETYRQHLQRGLLGEMLPLAEELAARLRELPAVRQADFAGSARRGRETVGDLDLLAASEQAAQVCEAFAASGVLEEVTLAGDTKVSGRLPGGRQVDLRCVPPDSYGAALQYFIGSQAHNLAVRARAQRMGLTVNEYGVFEYHEGEVGTRVAGATEQEVYAALGLPWIPPELREDRGELQAAEEGRLPHLIEASDLRGDLHVHTTASDGHNTLEDMARAAEARGYEYLGVTEHSPSLYVANGLSGERLREHRAAVDELNERLTREGSRLHLLLGTEADLLPDGSVDLAPGTEGLLDYVIASVHQGFTPDADRMTHRILTALESGQVDILGHPTGRMLLAREAYGVHLEEVIAAAAKAQVALEINASPYRLDLDDVHSRLAQEQGALLCLNTDAHRLAGLDDMRYGVLVARRGWIEPQTVINTWPLERLRQWLAGRRK